VSKQVTIIPAKLNRATFTPLDQPKSVRLPDTHEFRPIPKNSRPPTKRRFPTTQSTSRSVMTGSLQACIRIKEFLRPIQSTGTVLIE